MLLYEDDFASREDSRQLLRASSDYRWVTPDEWRDLLISRSPLVRADVSKAGVLGLLDPTSGRRFVIEQERIV